MTPDLTNFQLIVTISKTTLLQIVSHFRPKKNRYMHIISPPKHEFNDRIRDIVCVAANSFVLLLNIFFPFQFHAESISRSLPSIYCFCSVEFRVKNFCNCSKEWCSEIAPILTRVYQFSHDNGIFSYLFLEEKIKTLLKAQKKLANVQT